MKSVTAAFVKIWGHTVGAVAWLESEKYAVFEFDPEFIRLGLDLSPIHMSLSHALQGKTKFAFPRLDGFTFSGLPGLLSDSLPDQWGHKVINAWQARKGKTPSSFNPVNRLCLVGDQGMGALEFFPRANLRSLSRATPVVIKDLMAQAQSVITEPPRFDSDRPGMDPAVDDLLKVAMSAGGSGPKAVIAMDDAGNLMTGQANKIPEGYAYWILKFDGMTEKSASLFRKPLGECRVAYAYYLMARAAGIQMAECRLLEENGLAHLLTKRFDREENGQKLHMQTLGAIAHFGWHPPGRYGYEHAFQVMRKIGIGKVDQEQLFRRMVFNALTRNTDDHIKKIAFLMNKKGQWQLSPAYDLTYSYNPIEYMGSRHSLSINGKRKGFTRADFLAVAEAVEISRAGIIIEEVASSVQGWPSFAREAGVNQDRIGFIGEEHHQSHNVPEA